MKINIDLYVTDNKNESTLFNIDCDLISGYETGIYSNHGRRMIIRLRISQYEDWIIDLNNRIATHTRSHHVSEEILVYKFSKLIIN